MKALHLQMLPNLLTASRIVLSPFFLALYLIDNPYCKVAAFLIVMWAEISDLLDGRIARKYGVVSDVGKLLDPLSDMIFHFTAFLAFLASGHAALWMVALIFYRNSLMSWLRLVAATQNRIIAAKSSGKFKTALQGAVILLITGMAALNHWFPIAYLVPIANTAMGIVAIVTATSMFSYIKDNVDIILHRPETKGH